MIEKLTREQTDKLPEWRDKWLKIGLSCEPCDFDKAKAAASIAYRSAGLEPPAIWLLMDCPVSGAIAAAMLLNRGAQVRAQVGAQVRVQVGDQVGAQVRVQVWDQVGDQVGAQVWDQVWAQVRAQVRVQVGDQVGDQVYGSHDSGWLSWLDYFGSIVGLKCVAPAQGLIDLAKHCGWWAPYKNVCILQHRHCELHRDGDNRLHNEKGAAVLYRSGLGVWALHGVRVPKWLVETPAEELDPALFAQQENAEVRREFIRKIGAERLCQKLGTKITDKQGDYELHLVDLKGTTGQWPYLKMRNPSIGVYHMEAVPKECDTVEKALNFRNGGPLEHLAPIT